MTKWACGKAVEGISWKGRVITHTVLLILLPPFLPYIMEQRNWETDIVPQIPASGRKRGSGGRWGVSVSSKASGASQPCSAAVTKLSSVFIIDVTVAASAFHSCLCGIDSDSYWWIALSLFLFRLGHSVERQLPSRCLILSPDFLSLYRIWHDMKCITCYSWCSFNSQVCTWKHL